MPVLKDDELSKVNGGVGIGYDWANGLLTIDLTANPELSVEQAYQQFAPAVQVMGAAAMETFNKVMDTVSKHKGISKCEVKFSDFSVTYYIDGVPYTQQQVDAMQ